ncbi:MAG: hypothetical protein JXB50_04420 [Spirochaetes bacterium]|nr:hypothetical protein [Spirochaetota bacterium]
MKRVYIIFVLIILLTICKKQTSDKTEEKKDDNVLVENVTQYMKYSAWAYALEEDIGKKPNEVKDKKLLNFGNAVIVKISKKINGKTYYKIQLPDNSEYWTLQDNLAKKFIVINKEDVKCYENPDDTYISKIKLQPGDYGTLLQEGTDDWIKVEFGAYRSIQDDQERKWVGVKWIKDGYTTDITVAHQAYYLYLANYNLIQQKNKTEAIKYLKEALDVQGGVETEITPLIKETIAQLESQQ